MNRLLMAGLCAGFLLLSVVSMRAQDNKLPAVPKRKFKHNARITSVYDEAKNQTLVEFHIRVAHRGVALFKNGEMPELIAVKEGENISLGKTSLEKSKTLVRVDEGQMSFEMLFANFTYPGLLRLVNAKSVVMKVGQLEFKLVDRELEALRDLASRMTP